ncbi:MAG: phosphatase PAP2 family protein [Lachnospiraceae bacterium]|nr:phosphatase PAP2 family protein [Lachnospiraceae bacterium]
MVQFLLNIDQSILLWIQDVLRIPVLNPFFVFITNLGNAGAIWLVISVLLLIPKRTRKIGVLSILALIGSLLINNLMLKNLVGRTRPYENIANLQLLVHKASDFSFPSGHTGSSFAAAYVLYKELPKKYGIPAMILAGLIGFSRLYVGIHYPTDVLAGTVLGIFIAIWTRKLFYIWASGGKMNRIKQFLYI